MKEKYQMHPIHTFIEWESILRYEKDCLRGGNTTVSYTFQTNSQDNVKKQKQIRSTSLAIRIEKTHLKSLFYSVRHLK